MQGNRPRDRSKKRRLTLKFDYESHFIEFEGGEVYQCKICPASPDFLSLSDAVKHESSAEHVQSRRLLDRAPPLATSNPTLDEDDLELVSNPIASTSGPSLSQSGAAASLLPPVLSESDSPPPGTTKTHATHLAESDWHSQLDRWSNRPEAHFTVPGPALSSDPPDMVYDLFGVATEKWGYRGDGEDVSKNEDDEISSVSAHSEATQSSEPLSRELTPPPPSPPPEALNPHLWHNEEDAQIDLKMRGAELLDDAEEWWPFFNREEALFCLMTAFPRAVFSGKELDVVRWVSAKCNMPGMPPQSTVQSRFEHIVKLLGLESRLVQSKLGNYFAVNSLTSILKNEMANPLVRKELVFYPQDDGKFVNQAANGQHWMEEVDASLAAPMVRKSLQSGHQDYFIDEPLLASVTHSEDNSSAAPQPFLPIRFFQRQGNLFARCHLLVPTESGYIIDGDTHVELPLSSFLLPLPDFLSEHQRYNLPPPNVILGVQSTLNPDELQPWDKLVENPWCQKAEGKLVRSTPVWLYCDDTSGNASKKWNKHNSFLFTLTGLPHAQTQLPYNIHFLATSNIASPLEMLHELAKELHEARADGIVAYDCEVGEEVIAIPWVYAMQGDNPMQSELCSHIGMAGKFFCRVCHVRGKDKERDEGDGAEVKRVAEFMQIHDPRTASQTIASLREQEAIALRGTFSVIDNEARKTGVKDKYFMSFISMLKERHDKHRHSKACHDTDFLQSLREQMPEQPFNPALFIPDLDANQDTPVEILHVILLGIAKYFWRDAVARQTAEGKETLKARIDSLDLSGLGLSAPRGSTLVQYAGSLTGRDFRVILQIGVLVLYNLVPAEVYNAWCALSRLAPLAFQSEIDNIDDYVVILSDSINALLEATVLWTPQWFNKLKFHVLLHLPRHICHFGPAVLFATETFESYNFVIRLHDIGRAFSRLHAVRHLVSGGWVMHTINKSTKLPVSNIPRQAGSAVLDLRNDPEFMSLMGMSSLDSALTWGKVIARTPLILQPWASTLASQHIKPPSLMHDVDVTMCSRVVLRNGDIATDHGYVMIKYQGSCVPAQIIEILALRQCLLGLTVQIGSLLPSVDTYDMPGFGLHKEFSFISLEKTSLLGLEVQHCGDLSDLVLNVTSLRSASLIQPLQSPLTLSGSGSDIAQRAVTILQEKAARKQAEQEEKEREKVEKAEKKEQKKQEREQNKKERELRRAEKEAKQAAKAGGRSGKGKRRQEDEEPGEGSTTQA